MCDPVKNSARSDSPDNPLLTALPAPDRVVDSNVLFAQGNVILIQHHGECYVLRRTRSGKLILTK